MGENGLQRLRWQGSDRSETFFHHDSDVVFDALTITLDGCSRGRFQNFGFPLCGRSLQTLRF